MQGEYDRVIALRPELDRAPSPELADAISWAYVVLGNQLSGKALVAEGQERDQLFQIAGEKYGAALDIKPDKHEALNNWGNALSDQALTKTGEEADRLFQLAGEKFAGALAIKPDKHQALGNWGDILVRQARRKAGSDAERLLRLAEEKCLAAEAIRRGSGAYNIACVRALLGDEAGCRRWLEVSREAGDLERKDLETDADLENVRSSEWFQALLAQLGAAPRQSQGKAAVSRIGA